MSILFDRLHKALKKKLPGTEVQWQMASSDRMVKNYPRLPSVDAVEAAVVILIYPTDNSYSTLLIQRPQYNGVHSGQISFPGGKWEHGDKDLTGTALRETREETGIKCSDVIVAGHLTPLFIPVSNINVTPVVGYLESLPKIIPDRKEVSFTFAADLHQLADPHIVKETRMDVTGGSLKVKYFDYNGHVIWGATAMILHELLVVAKREGITFLQ